MQDDNPKSKNLLKIIQGFFIITLTISILCLLILDRSEAELNVLNDETWEVISMNSDKTVVDRIVNGLNNLIQYEIDKIFIVEEARDGISNVDIKSKLLAFKKASEENINELSSQVKSLGGTPPSYSMDFKGYFMQGYVVIRGLVSDIGVLKALLTNEELVLNAYEKVLKMDLQPSVKSSTQNSYVKNKEFHEYIKEQIKLLQ